MLTIEELDDSVRKVFSESRVKSVETVYEHVDGQMDTLKLIFVIHQLQTREFPVMLTKLIFKVDSMKISLKENSLSYLYDINCKYRQMFFKGEEDLQKKLRKIIKDRMFGPNLLAMSEFMNGPATQINEELKKSGTVDHTVFNVKYDPKVEVLPCESQSFDFTIDVNNAYKVEMNIRKNNKNDFTYNFEMNGKYIKKEVHNLQNIAKVAAETIKNNLQV